MKLLKFTLVTDGSSDVVLKPILKWLLRYVGVECQIEGEWADLRDLPNPPKTLQEKIQQAVQIFPCKILFIHRDAEKMSRNNRACEIARAAEEAFHGLACPPFVCVVPVRMQEAWLIFDAEAIKKAAGNPNGKTKLNLPSLKNIESHPNPKHILHQSLKKASGLPRRRLKKFDEKVKVHLVPEYIEDFSPLLKLPAFKTLHNDLAILISQQGWDY
jgi:hypothetical protein